MNSNQISTLIIKFSHFVSNEKKETERIFQILSRIVCMDVVFLYDACHPSSWCHCTKWCAADASVVYACFVWTNNKVSFQWNEISIENVRWLESDSKHFEFRSSAFLNESKAEFSEFDSGEFKANKQILR